MEPIAGQENGPRGHLNTCCGTASRSYSCEWFSRADLSFS